MKTVKETKLKIPKKTIFRKCSASISILGLVWSTTSFAVEKDNTIDMIDKVFNSAMGQIQNSMQQNQMMSQQASMMSQLQPQTIPSKFFPHCKISQARGAFPKKACAAGVQSPQALSGIEQMANLGNTYSDMYEQLMSPAQNSAYPVGLQCLENAKKGMVKSLQDRMNSLQALQDKIEKEAQFFKEQNKKLLTEMDKSHKELFGGGSGDLDARTKDFSKYFDTNCQNIIGTDNLAKASSAGLNGIRVGLMSTNKDAANFALNRGQIEGDINKQIQKVKAQIKEQGIQSWREDVAKGDGSINGQDLARMGVNKPAVSIVMSEINRFDSKMGTIQKELKKIDPSYEIPPMDKNFGTDFAEFTKGADDFFKKKYINECVTMADKGVAISPDQILSSLKSGVKGGGGIALKNYKSALQNILNSDSFIEDKMRQIQQLDQKYQGSDISISYKDSGSQTIKSNTYDLFKATVNSCAQKFTQTDTFSTSGTKGVSQQKKIKRAKEYLNDLKELESTFASQIGNKIYDSVMNCSGRSEKPTTCSSSDAFNQNSDAFCMKHATSCSGKVQQCYKKADALVEAKKSDIKSMQAKYNKNVTALIAREDAYLKQVKTQVLADAEYLSKYFPGANYQVPEGLFIKMPENQESEFGVELAGGGSLDFMKDLPAQIGKLKETLAKQSSKIEDEISQYIGDQKTAMAEQKNKWDNLAEECYGAAQAFRGQVAKGNAEMQQQQQELLGKIGEFCNKYGQLGNSNPLAGCDDSSDYSAQSLYEDMSGVVSGISSEHEMALSEYRNACAQFNNEKENGSEDDDDDDNTVRKSSIADICRKSGNDSSKIKKKLIEVALNGIPSDLEKHEDAIKKYIKSGDEDDLPSVVKKSDYKDEVLDDISELYSSKNKPDLKKLKSKASELVNGGYPDDMKELANTIHSQLKAKTERATDATALKVAIDSGDDEKISKALKAYKLMRSALKEKDGLAEVEDKDFATTGKASKEMKAELKNIVKNFSNESNFCSAHNNDALLSAIKSCTEDDDAEKCVKDTWKKNKKNETDATRSADRAIASVNDTSFNSEWSKIGERTKEINCQASSESERGIDSYFQQMQQIGGADFSGQIGFGQ